MLYHVDTEYIFREQFFMSAFLLNCMASSVLVMLGGSVFALTLSLMYYTVLVQRIFCLRLRSVCVEIVSLDI